MGYRPSMKGQVQNVLYGLLLASSFVYPMDASAVNLGYCDGRSHFVRLGCDLQPNQMPNDRLWASCDVPKIRLTLHLHVGLFVISEQERFTFTAIRIGGASAMRDVHSDVPIGTLFGKEFTQPQSNHVSIARKNCDLNPYFSGLAITPALTEGLLRIGSSARLILSSAWTILDFRLATESRSLAKIDLKSTTVPRVGVSADRIPACAHKTLLEISPSLQVGLALAGIPSPLRCFASAPIIAAFGVHKTTIVEAKQLEDISVARSRDAMVFSIVL